MRTAQESLSLHAIPYLLALFEDWEETYVGNDIARCICTMLDNKYYEDEKYKINRLGDMFTDFSAINDLDLFYYKGKEFYSGDLTKTIIAVAANFKKIMQLFMLIRYLPNCQTVTALNAMHFMV